MIDEDLANKVVKEGVGELKHECYWIDHAGLSANRFVRDWRTAGALIEQRTAAQMLRIFGGMGARVKPTPLEIIEKTIEYLNGE